MNYLDIHKHKQRVLNKLVQTCQHLLITSRTEKAKRTRRYLKSRISSTDQSIWQFGYFPSDEDLSDLTSIVSKKDLESIHIYYPKFLAGGIAPHGHFSDHNLVMPFRNEHGDIVAVLGRSLLSEEKRQELGIHKYKYTAGCQKDLYVYGLDKARESIIEKDVAIGVEGQFDCIALHNQGIKNAVAFGWANMSRYQFFQVHRYTNNIVLMFDNDEAGQKAKKRVRDRYKEYANIKVVSPPKGFKDIDEFFRLSTKERILDVIESIKNFGEGNGQKV